jgi:hypothetical protein
MRGVIAFDACAHFLDGRIERMTAEIKVRSFDVFAVMPAVERPGAGLERGEKLVVVH